MDMNKDGSRSYQVCERIVFANGESVSIQAGALHYSSPRENSVSGSYSDYSEFEFGFPSVKPTDEIMQYAEDTENPTNTIYAYVPIQLIVDWINEMAGATHSLGLLKVETVAHGSTQAGCSE